MHVVYACLITAGLFGATEGYLAAFVLAIYFKMMEDMYMYEAFSTP